MTYKELQDAVLGRRFPAASQRANAKRWLRTAYSDVWAAYDWNFKRVSREPVAVAAGGLVEMPSAFGKQIALYDDLGVRLAELSQERFEEQFDLTEGGNAFGFMVVNRQIVVAPDPGTATYQLSYKRRLAHLTPDGVADDDVISTTVSAGFMDGDSDLPLWDEEHHAVLIPRATVIGLIEMNDPTWDQQQVEYERQLDRMRSDLETVRPALQWGAQAWDA